jgi:hypothetical protein
MKKVLCIMAAVVAVSLLVAVMGCTHYPGDVLPPLPENPVYDNGAVDGYEEPTPAISGKTPPGDMNWISPGKVMVDNFHPGARAEYPLTVHNGNDYVTTFGVGYRFPDNVADEYVKPSLDAQDWVIVADATPVMEPKETRDILIVLDMPEDSAVFAPRWEFWISVVDLSQEGMVRTELCSRWLISMRSG